MTWGKDRILLDNEVFGTPGVSATLLGSRNQRPIAIAIDKTVLDRWPLHEQFDELLMMKTEIQEAAGRAFAEGRVNSVHKYYSTELEHDLIALTSEDV